MSCFRILIFVGIAMTLMSLACAQISEPLRVDPPIGESLRDIDGSRVQMGQSSCDKGTDPLKLDWDEDPSVHTCSSDTIIPVNKRTRGRIQCAVIPESYVPWHHCFNERITYRHRIPHHGSHRPVWPRFGEYKYLPAQRWLHSIEHGAVVMLYDPCADPDEVDKLRTIVKGCIRKHVISAWDKMTSKRPLALVAWGCRFEMSHVNQRAVVNFIRNKGLQGPEGNLARDGRYALSLLEPAQIPEGSDRKDSVLCPNYPF